VKANRLNLRSGPGENFSVIGRVEKSIAVTVIESKGEWSKIEPPAGSFAFVAAHLVNARAGRNAAAGRQRHPSPAAIVPAPPPVTAVTPPPPIVPAQPPVEPPPVDSAPGHTPPIAPPPGLVPAVRPSPRRRRKRRWKNGLSPRRHRQKQRQRAGATHFVLRLASDNNQNHQLPVQSLTTS